MKESEGMRINVGKHKMTGKQNYGIGRNEDSKKREVYEQGMYLYKEKSIRK